MPTTKPNDSLIVGDYTADVWQFDDYFIVGIQGTEAVIKEMGEYSGIDNATKDRIAVLLLELKNK